MQNRLIFLLSSLGVIALFVVIVFSLADPTQAERQPFAGDNPNSDLIASLQQELTNAELSPKVRENIEQRIALLNKQAPQQAEGYQNPAPRDPQKAPVDLPQDGYYKIPDGIEANPVPPRQSDLVITNAWRKTVKDHPYIVYAGHLSLDPNQSAVMIFTSDPYGFVIYRTPEPAGSIRIVSEKEMVIELKSETGGLFYFDVVQEAFVVDGEYIKVDPGTGESREVETSYPAP
ncbi:MAG: hypothetical protein HY835_11500 [Anaerolineae bacterium]|nr:hypothetical protein [Anaerolineae bacterium]